MTIKATVLKGEQFMGKAGVLMIVAAASLTGCCGLHCPTLESPGTADSQRAWAQRYDPYPETEVGPTVVGGRPRDFDVTRAEPQRARHFFQTAYDRSLNQGRR